MMFTDEDELFAAAEAICAPATRAKADCVSGP